MKTIIKILISTLFVIISINKIIAQVDIASPITGHIRNNGYYVGWDNTGTQGSLEIRNDFSDHINFSTNGNPRMTILGSNTPGYTNEGFVGIGTSTPAYRLDVSGDIRIAPAASAFYIEDNPVLHYMGNNVSQYTSNIFVGVGAALNKNSI
jgi:hypothetical protein